MTSVIPVDLSFLGGVTQYDSNAQLKLLCLSIQNCNFAFKKVGVSDFQKSATMLIHHPFRDEITPSAVYIENREITKDPRSGSSICSAVRPL